MKRLLVALMLVFSAAVPAVSSGHAFPDHSDPKVGSTIASAPGKVRIWFDGDLEPLFCTIMVHRADDTMVDKKDGGVNPSDTRLLEVSVPQLPPGPYRVFWKVVARDGHRTQGDFSFTVKQ